MRTILIALTALLISACSIKEPRVTFGKKCVEKDNQIVYSYVWLYDKQVGLKADNITCTLIKK